MYRKHRIAILALFLSGAWATSSVALQDTRGVRLFKAPSQAFESSEFDPAASRGLFVGVSDFDNDRASEASNGGFEHIPYAVDDAIDLAHEFAIDLELIDPTGVTLCLSGDPKKNESAARLQALIDAGAVLQKPERNTIFALLGRLAKESSPGGMLVVSFATHGFSLEGEDFIVASDSTGLAIADTGLDVSRVLNQITSANAKRQLVFLDACREKLNENSDHRAGGADAASAMGQAFADAITESSGLVVMAGARAGGYAYDDHERKNGVFTASILEGLNGKASSDGRGFVTPAALADYVNTQVCAWTRQNQRVPESLCGITHSVEGPASTMPLAVDPKTFLPPQEYRARVGGVLEKLRQNQGDRIPGQMFDRVKAALPDYYPAELERRQLVDALVDQIQVLDGTAKTQDLFLPYLQNWFQRWGEAMPKAAGVSPRAVDKGPNRSEPKPKRKTAASIETLEGSNITVKIPDATARTYCSKLTEAGLNVDCKVVQSSSTINQLTIKCATLPEELGDILSEFLGLQRLNVKSLRRKYRGNATICARSGAAELMIAR